MIVHIVINDKPLCGFTADPPSRWPYDVKAVDPEEAHYCNCYTCIAKMNDRDELESGRKIFNGVAPERWPR